MNKSTPLIALAILVAAACGVAQDVSTVLVWVTLDGTPADAMVQTIPERGTARVAYNDVREPGLVRLHLTPGHHTLRVEHGAGFVAPSVEKEVMLAPGEQRELHVRLTTTFSPAQAWSYYSADLHVHSSASWDGFTPPDQLVAVQRAAALDIGSITDHNTIDGHAPFAAAAEERGFPVVLGEEITTLQGHWNAFPLNRVVEFTPRKTPTEYFADARAAGATLIQVCHPSASLIGYFHLRGRPQYDDGFDLVEIFNGEFSPDDARTIEQLYELWNQGHRYVAVGVSDDHDWMDLETRTGRARTYVHLDGDLTVDNWLEALAAGRAYATYGPHVRFTAQEGAYLPGDTITLAPSESLQLTAETVLVPRHEQRSLDRAYLIKNGQRVEVFTLSGEQELIRWTEQPTEDAWYAIYVVAEDGDRAHTNPIWVEVAADTP